MPRASCRRQVVELLQGSTPRLQPQRKSPRSEYLKSFVESTSRRRETDGRFAEQAGSSRAPLVRRWPSAEAFATRNRHAPTRTRKAKRAVQEVPTPPTLATKKPDCVPCAMHFLVSHEAAAFPPVRRSIRANSQAHRYRPKAPGG